MRSSKATRHSKSTREYLRVFLSNLRTRKALVYPSFKIALSKPSKVFSVFDFQLFSQRSHQSVLLAPDNREQRAYAISERFKKNYKVTDLNLEVYLGCLPFTTTFWKFRLESKWYTTTFRVIPVENFQEQRNV